MGPLKLLIPVLILAALGYLFMDNRRLKAELTTATQNLNLAITTNKDNQATIDHLQSRQALTLDNILVNVTRKELIPEIRYVEGPCDTAVRSTFDSLREAQARSNVGAALEEFFFGI